VIRFLSSNVTEAATPSNSSSNSTRNATETVVVVKGELQLQVKTEPDAIDNTTTTAGGKANVTAVQLCARMQVSSFVDMLQQVSSYTCCFRSLCSVMFSLLGLLCYSE
jgi:hypothetical protein